MLWNEIQSEILVTKEEMEELWNNPELDTKGVIHGLRKIIKERTGYEYVQEIIRGLFIAEDMKFSARKARKVYPVRVTEGGISKRIHKLAFNPQSKGKSRSYDCISTEKL